MSMLQKRWIYSISHWSGRKGFGEKDRMEKVEKWGLARWGMSPDQAMRSYLFFAVSNIWKVFDEPKR